VENPEAAQVLFELSLYAAIRANTRGHDAAIFCSRPPAEQQRRLRIALQMPVSTGIAMLTQDLYGADLWPVEEIRSPYPGHRCSVVA
jgi:hypothetical protein